MEDEITIKVSESKLTEALDKILDVREDMTEVALAVSDLAALLTESVVEEV